MKEGNQNLKANTIKIRHFGKENINFMKKEMRC